MHIVNLQKRGHHELVGKGFFEVFPKSDFIDILNWEEIFDEILRRKMAISDGIKTWVDPQREGISHETLKYFEIVQFPVLNDKGDVVVIVRSLVDVTDKVMESYLLDEAQTAAKIGNWWVNLNTGSVRWSSGIKELLEVGEGFELNLENLRMFYCDPLDLNAFLDEVKISMKENRLLKSQFNVRTSTRKVKRLKVIGKPDHESDSCSGIHGMAIDITRQYNDTRRLKEIYFRHNHDFRAPLARILGVAEFLNSSELLDPLMKQLLETIVSSPMKWIS